MSELPISPSDEVYIARNLDNVFHNYNLTLQLNQNVSSAQLSTALRQIMAKYPILAYQMFRSGDTWIKKPLDAVYYDDVVEHRTLVEEWGETFLADLDTIFFSLDSPMPLWKIVVSDYSGVQRISFVSDMLVIDRFSAVHFVDDLTYELSVMAPDVGFTNSLFDEHQSYVEPIFSDAVIPPHKVTRKWHWRRRKSFTYPITVGKNVVRLIRLSRDQANALEDPTAFFSAAFHQALCKTVAPQGSLIHVFERDCRVPRYKKVLRYSMASRSDAVEFKASDSWKKVLRKLVDYFNGNASAVSVDKRKPTIISSDLGTVGVKYGDWEVQDLVFSQNTAGLAYFGLNTIATPGGVNITLSYSVDFDMLVENGVKVMDECVGVFRDHFEPERSEGEKEQTQAL